MKKKKEEEEEPRGLYNGSGKKIFFEKEDLGERSKYIL